MPVVDDDNKLNGVVTIDDVLDVAEQAATEDAQKFGGLEALTEPYATTPLLTMVQKRATWLVILFITFFIWIRTDWTSVPWAWMATACWLPFVVTDNWMPYTVPSRLAWICPGPAILPETLPSAWRVSSLQVPDKLPSAAATTLLITWTL